MGIDSIQEGTFGGLVDGVDELCGLAADSGSGEKAIDGLRGSADVASTEHAERGATSTAGRWGAGRWAAQLNAAPVRRVCSAPLAGQPNHLRCVSFELSLENIHDSQEV